MRHYNAGDYPAAVAILAEADRQHPGTGSILYNLACFECLAGHPDESLAHLEQVVRLEASWKALAQRDPDFEAIRGTPEFVEITSLMQV